MARVTVEDCIENIPNRFELVGIAARRAKQIASGNPITIDRDNDKDSVVSLREVADKTVDFSILKEEIVESYSRFQRPDVIEGVDTPPTIENLPAASEDYVEETEETFEISAEGFGEEEIDEDPTEGEEPADLPEGMSFDDEDMDVKD